MWAIAALAGGVLSAGCSLTIDADRVQCSSDLDCRNRGSEFAHSTCVDAVCEPVRENTKTAKLIEAGPPPAEASVDPLWGCMDQPKVTTAEPGPFKITFHLADILSQTPQVGVTAKACKKIDVDCEIPESPAVLTDDKGDVTLELAKNFSGYVEFTGEKIMPGLYFFNPPVDGDKNPVSVQIVTPGIVAALTKSLGSVQKEELGLMLLNAMTCDGKAAEHVSFAASGTAQGSVLFYAIGGLPASNATETDSAGFGGFVNVEPGTVPVTATETLGNREIGTISILVRAGTITYGHLVPLGR